MELLLDKKDAVVLLNASSLACALYDGFKIHFDFYSSLLKKVDWNQDIRALWRTHISLLMKSELDMRQRQLIQQAHFRRVVPWLHGPWLVGPWF